MCRSRALVFVVSFTLAFSALIAPFAAAPPVQAVPSGQVAAPTCGGDFLSDADATVHQGQPGSPLGGSNLLQVLRLDGKQISAESLLHFPVTAREVPPGSSIRKAVLELYPESAPPVVPFTLTVAGVANRWVEQEVTWNSRPAARGSFGARSYHYRSMVGAASEPLRIDVTALVTLWASGAITETSVLLQPGPLDTNVLFLSREGGANLGYAPRLTVRCGPAQREIARTQAGLDELQAAGLRRLAARSQLSPTLRLDRGELNFALLDLALPSEAGMRSTDRARWFTSVYSDALRLNNPALQLQLSRFTRDGRHVFFRQRYNGIPVFPAELGVHFMGNRIVAVNGNYLPDITADPTPQISAEQAEAIVLGMSAGGILSNPSQLRYYNSGLNGGPDHETYLVWQVSLKNGNRYFIDSATGEIRLEQPSAYPSYDMDIETGNLASFSATCAEWGGGTTADDHLCSEDGCNSDGLADPEAGAAWWNIYDTYWWYRLALGRDSFGGGGEEIQIYIHVGDANGNPWHNAQYLSGGDCMEFGDGYAAASDVMSHEYTHAVVRYTADLTYSNESGALNESFADVFGELIEDGAADWQHGEELPGGANRSLSNPLSHGDPDIYEGDNWHELAASPASGNDYGGVHTNSGVPNKAAYLLVHGGSFNNYTISGIGMVKGRALLYNTMLSLGSGSGMLDMRNWMVGYAQTWAVSGVYGFIPHNVCQVRNAYAAVGLGQGDVDCDGIENNAEADMDNDYVNNSVDNCPTVSNTGQGDLDGDGQGNACDTDDDEDGHLDGADNCPLVANGNQADWNQDGQGDACDDSDGDYAMDNIDNCRSIPNPDQLDTDGDGQGDLCDNDDDGDLDPDTADNCPLVSNANQANGDEDLYGDVCDLCPSVSSPDNGDPDHDGLGNPCDADDDDDTVLDGADNCPLVPNPGQLDTDHNGVGLACDQAERDFILSFSYKTKYKPAIDGLRFPTPDNCPMCGQMGEFGADYWREVVISMDQPFYAQIVDSNGRILSHSSAGARSALVQSIRFQPAPYAFEGGQIAPNSTAVADALRPDGVQYFVEVYPAPGAVPGPGNEVSLTFNEGAGQYVYLPLIRQ